MPWCRQQEIHGDLAMLRVAGTADAGVLDDLMDSDVSLHHKHSLVSGGVTVM